MSSGAISLDLESSENFRDEPQDVERDGLRYRLPTTCDLESWGMTEEGYHLAMREYFDALEMVKEALYLILAEAPESPTTKTLRHDLNSLVVTPSRRAPHPGLLQFKLAEYLFRIILFQKKAISKRTKLFKHNNDEMPDGPEELQEIEPKTATDERAMIILRALKRQPDRGLNTLFCKELIDTAENNEYDTRVVRRAMRRLAELYHPAIVFEQFNGMKRVRLDL